LPTAAIFHPNPKKAPTLLNRPCVPSDQINVEPRLTRAMEGTMKRQMSSSDLRTYKRWLAGMGAVYFTIGVAVLMGISVDVMRRTDTSMQTFFNDQARPNTTVSYNR
jgi:hypothetical protein